VSERDAKADSAPTTAPVPTRPERDVPGLEPGAVLAGRYRLVRVLGEGGMGRVFRAEHVTLGTPVAIKTMHAHVAATADYARRFTREARAASLLAHPNVVRVLDFGDDAGRLYLVMELLTGTSLARWLEGLRAPPPLAEACELALQLLDALAVAHAAGVVHRDLKPDNAFLAEEAGRRVLKVVDFGLARFDDVLDTGPTLTKTEMVAGTPAYMSPEQCRSLVVGPSADLYAFGCVLTELLQLAPPFAADSNVELMAKHMFAPPPAVLRRPAGAEPVPPLLDKLRLDLLSKLPERRPETAEATRARLLEAMSVEATELRLPTRKGDEPLGERAARTPDWHASETVAPARGIELRPVALLRVAPTGGLDASVSTALASRHVDLVEVSALDDLARRGLEVVVVDAGDRVEDAAGWVRRVLERVPGARVLVCAAGLDVARMSEVVAAGAADAARSPVAPDVLGKKVERVLRRGR
jgi:serine/threonine-protein kinase